MGDSQIDMSRFRRHSGSKRRRSGEIARNVAAAVLAIERVDSQIRQIAKAMAQMGMAVTEVAKLVDMGRGINRHCGCRLEKGYS